MRTHNEHRVLSVLGRHCRSLSTNLYTDLSEGEERHCVLGWLAVDANIPLPCANFNSHVLGMEGTLKFAALLAEEYGLSFETLKRLQFANDDECDANALIEEVRQVLSEESQIRTRVA